MNTLHCLSYSPWSEKARWALDVQQISYTRRAFRPLIDELPLRLKSRRFGAPLTVPILHDGGRWYYDSYAIAEFADEAGAGTLFGDSAAQVEYYNALSERGLAAGRALGLPKLLDDPAALAEMLPRGLRGRFGTLPVRVAAAGVKRAMAKYGTEKRSPKQHTQVMRECLAIVREDLKPAAHGPSTLLGTFSYADVCVVQILQFVAPVTLGGFRIGEGGGRAYALPALAEEFADLLEWRAALYAAYR